MRNENWMFFKQWYKHPFRLGTCLPIGKSFANTVAKKIAQDFLPEKYDKVVELGAGTGRLTNALVNNDVKKITTVELDSQLNLFLSKRFCDLDAVDLCLKADAAEIDKFFSPASIDLVVSVIPLMYLPLEKRVAIVEAGFKVLKPGGKFIHVCYTPVTPLGKSSLFKVKKLYSQWGHLPPAFIWEFTEKEKRIAAA